MAASGAAGVMPELLSVDGLLPHGLSFAGHEGLLWLHVAADALTALAYFMIPMTLVYFLRRRQGALSFGWAISLFAAFILLCGTSYVLGLITLWSPIYYAQGLVKLLTALVSIATAAAILPLVPRLLAMRSPEELEIVNQQLAQTNARLEETNHQLKAEMAAREVAERELRRSLTDLNRAVAELEQFAYIASHDLQAPLRNIAGFVQLLERRYRERLEGDGLEFLDFIGQGVRQMKALIEDLLALSRVGRGSETRLEAKPLAETLNEALKPLAAQIASSGAEIVHGELPTLLAEHRLLAQLFQNLIGNALKFQQPGARPRIEVRCTAEGERWHVVIADNGIGIPPAQLEAVFAIFRRLHPQDEYEGSGIGLAICRKIAVHHGGELYATSAGEGRGSEFHLLLPQQPSLREVRMGVADPSV
jgi:chemotaxis family two-component system sensor kinase Cph1